MDYYLAYGGLSQYIIDCYPLITFCGYIGAEQTMSLLGFPFRTSKWMMQNRVSDASMPNANSFPI